MKYSKKEGFTLMEAMIVVMLLGILAVLAYPSFKDTIERNRASAAQAELNKAMAYARSEAISRNRDVGVCPQPASSVNSCGGEGEWSNGFFVYVDKDRNGSYTASSNDEIIQYYYLKQPVQISIGSSNDIQSFVWQAGGVRLFVTKGNAKNRLSNTTIDIIPAAKSHNDKNKKQCTIANTGRMLCP